MIFFFFRCSDALAATVTAAGRRHWLTILILLCIYRYIYFYTVKHANDDDDEKNEINIYLFLYNHGDDDKNNNNNNHENDNKMHEMKANFHILKKKQQRKKSFDPVIGRSGRWVRASNRTNLCYVVVIIFFLPLHDCCCIRYDIFSLLPYLSHSVVLCSTRQQSNNNTQ